MLGSDAAHTKNISATLATLTPSVMLCAHAQPVDSATADSAPVRILNIFWRKSCPIKSLFKGRGHCDNGIDTSNAAPQGVTPSLSLHDIPLLLPGKVLEVTPGRVVTQDPGHSRADPYFLRDTTSITARISPPV